MTSIAETVVTNFFGGTSTAAKLNSPTVDNGKVTLTWNAGGRRQLSSRVFDQSFDLDGSRHERFAQPDSGGYTNVTTLDNNFYRVGRTAVASYDSFGGTTGGTGGFVAPGGSVSRRLRHEHHRDHHTPDQSTATASRQRADQRNARRNNCRHQYPHVHQ
ncbi:MAG: hypothetical protein WDN00_16455 [Limisphaerales bacterium]